MIYRIAQFKKFKRVIEYIRNSLNIHFRLKLRFLGVVFLSVLFISIESNAEWQEIIGIPEPQFGANEEVPAKPSPWNGAVPGFYYVCNDCAGSTDSSNTYGWPSNPRKTIPNTIPAGSVVEIHGNYHGDYLTLNANGTSGNPVFFIGESYDMRPKRHKNG